ncbi:UPF0496 protein At1g20180 [Prunus avium]|uniref:UPF0496 protein At1g20180 n=1 Tax=Prunus avium TaxID=42229 RepID=A0A6P5TL74_PRUAV|nr:UPF0496 protein At1g20180 [Prunus avium]
MSKMKKILRTKLRSAFSKAGCRSSGGKGDRVGGNSFSNKLSVNEEYLQVFRTKSYVEMWDRVHGQLPSTSTTSSSSLPPNSYMDRSEYLLEPRQDILKDIISEEGLNLHHLLADYFEASLDACHICDLLIRTLHQTRSEYRKIKKLILKLSQRVLLLEQAQTHNHANDNNNNNEDDDEQREAIFGDLTTFALVKKNPLSIISPVQFRDIHDSHLALFNRLTLKHKKVQRTAKRNRICKKVGGIGLVVSHSALLIALLVFAIHSMIGIVVAPALMACSLGMCAKKMESAQDWLEARFPDSHLEQLDVAAKGVYILINDFDTMSRMVRRLHDEVEHSKAIAGMCVSAARNVKNVNGSSGNCEIFKEVVREFHATESGFVDQLEELEEHIYLCLLTINRSRRLVLEEIVATT